MLKNTPLHTDPSLGSQRDRPYPIPPTSTNRQLFKSSSLIILTFVVAFYPRVLAAMKVPSAVNFLHFFCILLLLIFTLPRIRSRLQVHLSTQLLFGLYALLLIISTSAFWNNAGIVNILLDFLLLSEPFIFAPGDRGFTNEP